MAVIFAIVLVTVAIGKTNCFAGEIVLSGLRIESLEGTDPFTNDIVARVHADYDIKVMLFGFNLDKVLSVLFTTLHKGLNRCDANITGNVVVENFENQTDEIIILNTNFPTPGLTYYICLRHIVTNLTNKTDLHLHEDGRFAYRFQGTEQEKMIGVTHAYRHFYMPLPVQILFILLLLCLSALFSGLNLGLMNLDLTELQVIKKSGTKKEKSYAERIIPVRKKGNYLLCTILIGIAVVNSSVSILFDDVTSGFVALIVSSILIVVFGEIVPQSICTRYGLAVGAYTIYLIQFFMTLTFPISWPTSKLLDKLFGRDFGRVYTRQRLIELIKLSTMAQKELEFCQEVAIISGALQLDQKTIEIIMTPIEEVFMVDIETILTPQSVGLIVENGHTRIPVYKGDRNTLVNVLNVKDLALVDPDDHLPLSSLSNCHPYPVTFVNKISPISSLLEEFKKGHYHMAFVQEESSKVIGLVTLEDIIEEIIQSEIYDESDVAAHREANRKFQRESSKAKGLDHLVPSDLVHSTIQFLRSSLSAFSTQLISDKVLHKLIVRNIKTLGKSNVNLYTMGKAADIYTVVLQGTLEVTAGVEQFVFEVGSFQHLGETIFEEILTKLTSQNPMESLEKITFIPDFTAKITNDITYLQVSSSDYCQAYIASMIEYESCKKQTANSLDMVQELDVLKLQNPGTVCRS